MWNVEGIIDKQKNFGGITENDHIRWRDPQYFCLYCIKTKVLKTGPDIEPVEAGV